MSDPTRFRSAVPSLPVSDERRAVACYQEALGLIEVTGTDALHEHCRALGVVHPNAALRNTPWGTREFGVKDPDGNLVTLFQRDGA